jgi:hypothetical protein
MNPAGVDAVCVPSLALPLCFLYGKDLSLTLATRHPLMRFVSPSHKHRFAWSRS